MLKILNRKAPGTSGGVADGLLTYLRMGKEEAGLGEGWHEPERHDGTWGYRWMKGHARLRLRNDGWEQQRALHVLAGHPFAAERWPVLQVFINGELIGLKGVRPHYMGLSFPLPPTPGPVIDVLLLLDKTFASQLTGDPRELGAQIREVGILSPLSPSHPVLLEVETTKLCNIVPPCVHCFPKVLGEGPEAGQHIRSEIVDKVLPLFKAADTVSLHGVGEPLTNPRIRELVEAIDHDDTYLSLCSNGILLNERNARFLVEQRVKQINISLDAATPETYKKIRRGDLTKILANIKRLARIKEELGSREPTITISMVLMRENASEAVRFVELAKEIGAQTARFSRLNPIDPSYPDDYTVEHSGFSFHYKEQMLPDNKQHYDICLSAARQRAAELGVFFSLSYQELT
ncbi:MAG: radical SAM protein [Candidatus Schekmanbacteria bacterium]|nr:radical SAM protein [Candidatus Schekmanbacteria bacterium]